MKKIIITMAMVMIVVAMILMIKDVVMPIGLMIYYGLNGADIILGKMFWNHVITSGIMSIIIFVMSMMILGKEADKEYYLK